MPESFFLVLACTTVLLAFAAQGRAASGSEALIEAVESDDLSRVQRLLEEGASPDSRNEKGVPALALAATAKNVAIVKALLAKGADANATTTNAAEELNGIPVVLYAATNGSAEVLQLILHAGANPNAHDGNGTTPLMAAAYLGNTEMIPVLLAAKADLEARQRKEENALMFAAEGGRYEVARLLLDAGAEVDALGEQKATPLMYAAQGGFDDVIALLVERGADVNRKAAPGLTALDLAKQNKQTRTVWLLENGGSQQPPELPFQFLRPFLYPEQPTEELFLNHVAEDEKLEAARQLALKGELRQARDILEVGREELQRQPLYFWALAYLQLKLGEREDALASLRKILTTSNLGSRETLRVWKLIRDLGEAPPPDLAKRVLGVIVETGLGPFIFVVAAYADGQPRLFLSQGACIIGDDWTDEETQKTQEIVHLAQELVVEMAPTESRELPKPGRVRFIFLTPGASYGAEESLAFLNHGQGRYVKVFAASDQLVGLLEKHLQAEQDQGKASAAPAPAEPPPHTESGPPVSGH